ncbi:mucin-5AC-like isoform X2 [Melanotaenia boesemani]|uniref:mucin-5AC-like isoform X2 n=1 Tax=Melanotaenia boesemani TaxID=1250792 RepID=UPI001C03E496|nr:mucin-5AC-like isoform X2 [Melanotaenia boesemani]
MDVANVSAMTLYLSACFFLFYHHPFFSLVFLLEWGGDVRRRGSLVRSVSPASLAPPTSAEALHTAGARALSNGASATEPRQQSSTATACRVSPMELPLGGPALRHYTQSRPRPHRQKLNYRPNRLQETIIESENEVLELMGRVDEGVEEFFTKRVLPTDTLNKQDEESITVHEVAPASSVPCPPPTKTLRRKLGDFFTLKKRRGLKSEPSQEGRPKKASIADLIRPLREATRSEKDKDKDRGKDHDKENEKEKAKEHPSAVTGESAVQETPVTGEAPLRGEAVPPRRALREGKSQSLILLSGSAAAGTTNVRNSAKKPFEGQHSFEQKLHLMLQRIGVSKPQPGETQNQEGEMKKAESEGTIIDSKPEPPPTFSKPRTMSASSDTRHQIRASVSAHEAAGKPALLPKPVIKPGPPPTTSGRNTPENELAQIQEAETNTPTKASPAATSPAPAAPPAPTPAATTTTSVSTISNSVPESASVTVSPASTATPLDTDICTDSVNSTAAATTPICSTGLDSKASISETSAPTTEPSTSIIPKLKSTSTSTVTPGTVSVPPTSSDTITPSLSVTSTIETMTTPSITTQQTVSAPSNQSSVSKTPTDLSTKSALVEPKGALTVDATPAAGNDADFSVTTAASSLSTSTSDMPSDMSTTISSVSGAGDKSTLIASSSTVTLVSSVPKTSCPSFQCSDTVIAAVPHDVPITTPTTTTSVALPPTTATPSVPDETTSPTSSDWMNSVSAPTASHPTILSPVETSSPSTSSSETNPTDTTSTATCLNRADTISTSSSAHTTDSDPPLSSNVSIILTPPVSSLPPTDSSSAPSHHLMSPAPSDGSPVQDHDISRVEKTEKPTDKDTEQELEMVQESKSVELDEEKKGVDTGEKSESDNEKPVLDNSDATSKEEQVEGVKAGEDFVAEPASGKESDGSRDEAVTEDLKEE